VLLDEIEALVSGAPRAYGHVVVDEAQDLSAMDLRALARRAPDRSMTVLGDLAQATAPAAQASWDAVIRHLGSPPTAHRTDLDLGYRVPAPIIDVANRLLAEAAPDVVPCRSVRLEGEPPRFVPVPAEAGPDRLRAEIERAVGDVATRHASVGVVAPPGLRALVDGLDAVDRGAAATVTVLDPHDAKGLEFDAVVVVEPDAIASGTARGLRLLYVAMTRAVQELVVIHARPLPAALAQAA
jgi:DNA helicase IV